MGLSWLARGTPLTFGEEPNDLLAKGRCQLSSLQHGVEAVPHGRSNPSENSVVKLITKTIQPWTPASTSRLHRLLQVQHIDR
jgi:hypothetical protein